MARALFLVFASSGASLFLAVGLLGHAACVPTGSAPPYDAGPSPAIAASFKPSLNVMSTPFEDDFSRPDAGSEAPVTSASAAPIPLALDAALRTNDATADAMAELDAGLLVGIPDAGERAVPGSNLGPNWTQMRTTAWKVENGRLCGQGAHNHTVWLNRTLPVNARIEYDAYALTEDGDLKSEVWGDGHSYATGTSYTNATSYLAILGGWKNTIHALARLSEHGTDRKEIHVDKDSDDPRQRSVVHNQLYQVKVERNDGKTVHFSVNGVEYLSWTDPAPLSGQGHDHFGFNEWESKVCFDNVKITPLAP